MGATCPQCVDAVERYQGALRVATEAPTATNLHAYAYAASVASHRQRMCTRVFTRRTLTKSEPLTCTNLGE